MNRSTIEHMARAMAVEAGEIGYLAPERQAYWHRLARAAARVVQHRL